MARTFTHFPDSAVCPLCGTADDKECTLVIIDGTGNGNIAEAQPVHIECIKKAEYHYNPKIGIIYTWSAIEDL